MNFVTCFAFTEAISILNNLKSNAFQGRIHLKIENREEIDSKFVSLK